MFKKPKKEEKDKKKSEKKDKKDKKLSSSGKSKGPPADLPPPAPAPTPESRKSDSLSNFSEAEGFAPAPAVEVPEEEGIIFGSERDASGRPSIKGATLEKLVERLTHTHTDQKYIQTFMLTFRSFTTPLEFLSLLKRRFYLEQQPGQSNEEFEASLRFVRTRTTNVIKHWIQKSFFDFQEDEQLRNEILHFLNNDFLTHVEPAARQLLKLFEKQMNGETSERERETIHGKKAPAPHLPRNLSHKSLNFRDFHPEEIARQLTLIEYSLYKTVKPWECLNQAWAKQDKEIKSPNILKMIDQFNNTSKWVTTEICKAADLRERTIVLQQMIEIAEYCKALKNFNAMMEVISGVNSASVFRLKQTWAGLPKKHLASYEEMQNLMSSDQSYKNFRAFLHSVNPPCIPYLGMYLTDLTFIEEGNQNFLQPSGAINFFKRQKLSEVIAEIQIYQNEPYNLEPVKFIQDFLLNAECLPEEQCYKMSLRREKRGGVVVSEDQQEDDEDDEPFGEMQKVEGYHFDEPDTDSNIKLEKTDSLLAEASFVPIKGATLIKLVERLTYHKYQDMEYGWAFLMTYRNFSTPHDFLDLLIIRYNMPFPKNPSKQQLTKFTSSRLIPIRLRIFNVLKNWITEYAVDFREDPTLYAKLIGFIERCKEDVKHSLDKPAANLQILAEKKVAEEPPAESLQLLGSLYSPDNPDLGKITEYDDEGMAEQLTLFDFNLFKTILPRECLATSWEDGSAVHIHYERYNFDLMKRWAATQIVMEKDIQKRYVVLSHLVKIADNLLQIRNFNCFVAIINGIMMISSGLATTLDWVPTPISEKYLSFQALVKTPKNLLSKEKAEDGVMLQTIPYVEAYLRRLNQFHDTFPDFIDSASSIINFEKRKKFYEVYKECFEKHKNNPFPFRLDETFQSYLLHVPIYEEEDIKRLAKSFPLEGPPSQRPTIHDLPAATRFPRDHEEKLNTTQDQPEEVSEEDNSSSENGTAQPEDQTASQIKSAILTVLGEDRELAQDILNNVRAAVTTEILQDFRDYAANMKDELSLLHSQFGILKPELGWEAAERIVRRKFPGSTVDVWRCFDADGFVYGWQEEVGLFVVESQQLVLLSVRVDEAFISSALRIAGLYVTDRSISDEDSQNLQVYILTSQCSEPTRAAAVSQGIAILDF